LSGSLTSLLFGERRTVLPASCCVPLETGPTAGGGRGSFGSHISSACQASSSALRIDRHFALESLRQDILNFRSLSPELLADRTFVVQAMRLNWQILKYVSPTLHADEELFLEALKQSVKALDYASKSILRDRQFILQAVKVHWRAIHYADEYLRGDTKILLGAVEQDARVLYYALPHVLFDAHFLLEATKINPEALQYASQTLRQDSQFIIQAIRESSWEVLRYADESVRDDQTVILEAFTHNLDALTFASQRLRQDGAFFSKLIQIDWRALKYAPVETRNDPFVILDALKQDFEAIALVPLSVRKNRKFLTKVANHIFGAEAHASSLAEGDIHEQIEAVDTALTNLYRMQVSQNEIGKSRREDFQQYLENMAWSFRESKTGSQILESQETPSESTTVEERQARVGRMSMAVHRLPLMRLAGGTSPRRDSSARRADDDNKPNEGWG